MKKMWSVIVLSGLSILLSSNETRGYVKNRTHGDDELSAIISDFESQLNKNMAKDSTGSISVAIFRGDEIIWSKAFGKSNNQRNIRADTNTVYRVGSISKTITAYIMMLLVQEGTIRLDDPVSKYVPEITQIKSEGSNARAGITFRELASHTSGLDNEPGDMANAELGRAEEWEKMLLELIPSTRFHFPEGRHYWYSNVGYAILGLAISRAANKPFIDLVNEKVFRSHGMKNSFYIIPPGYGDRIAAGYHWNQSSEAYSTEFADRQLLGRSYKVPNGGVFCTANDLARFAMALTSNTDVLAKNWRDSMQTVQIWIRKAKNEGYGFGLMSTGDSKESMRIGHEGQIAGFKAVLLFNPDSRIGLVWMRNSDNASANLERVTNIALTRLIKAVKK
jgi:CubicO group peptidase (beta-lactamase class C family)